MLMFVFVQGKVLESIRWLKKEPQCILFGHSLCSDSRSCLFLDKIDHRSWTPIVSTSGMSAAEEPSMEVDAPIDEGIDADGTESSSNSVPFEPVLPTVSPLLVLVTFLTFLVFSCHNQSLHSL